MSSRDRSDFCSRNAGFTLVEAVITIVLTGILAGVVAVFVTVPVKGYLDMARRTELSDIADSTLRRIARDIRAALPNSVRVAGGCAGGLGTTCFLEFIPIKGAGRYRERGPGDFLDFTAAADSFAVIGPGVDVAGGDSMVIFNLGIPGSDAYGGSNRRLLTTTGTGLGNVAYAGGVFPFASPARRFQIVGGPVTYACAPAGNGVLQRYSGAGYAFNPTQSPNSTPPPIAPVLLASRVSFCRFEYQAGPTQGSALATLHLSLTRDGETVSLVHQMHVNNVP
ncbi:MAG: type II secretion system protein J [Burkholderiales bacterium]